MKKLITVLLLLVLAVSAVCSAYAEADLYAVQIPKDDNSTFVMNILKTAEKIYLILFDFDLDTNGYPYTEKDGVVTIQMDGDIHEAHITDQGFDYPLTPEGPNVMMYPVRPVSSSGPADISGLSSDELIELNHQIQMKLFSEKLVDGITVPSGVYTVGADIPEGIYRVVYHMPYDTAFCSFYLQEAEGGTYSTLLGYGSSTEIGKIFLKNNAYVSIDGGDVVFFPYAGLFH